MTNGERGGKRYEYKIATVVRVEGRKGKGIEEGINKGV